MNLLLLFYWFLFGTNEPRILIFELFSFVNSNHISYKIEVIINNNEINTIQKIQIMNWILFCRLSHSFVGVGSIMGIF